MKFTKLNIVHVALFLGVALLSACGGDAGGTTATSSFTIGGTVTGLTGTGLVLQNNDGDNLAVNANGNADVAFTFAAKVASGAGYNVKVITQPGNPGQTCTVNSGTGTATANVTGISVICSTNAYTVGGTVTGLTGTGLVLQNNDGDNLTVNANGNADVAFTFATKVASGAGYNVKVLTQPGSPAQFCTVNNGTGTAAANVTGISVNCSTNAYTISGKVTGLTGTGLVLQNNDGDDLTVNANGNADVAFTFATKVASGARYNVKVITQPGSPVQTCSVNNGTGSGQVSNAAIDSVAVTCSTYVPRFAYVANNGDDTISIYTVNAATGQLRHNGYVAAGSKPVSLSIEPTGKFAYAANSFSNDISAYTINAGTGQLTKVTGSPFTGVSLPSLVAYDPSGKFAYVASGDASGTTITAYAIDAQSGALTLISAFTAGTMPNAIAITPNGKFVYVTNGVSNDVSAFSIAGTGVLTVIDQNGGAASGTTVVAGTEPRSISIDPSGQFAYVANSGSNNVSAYSINADTGVLTSIGDFPTGTTPKYVTVDPSGKYVYTANVLSNNVSAFSITATGVLTEIGSPIMVAANSNPNSINIDPSGKFAYVACPGSNEVFRYLIEANGALTSMGPVRSRSSGVSVALAKGTTAVTHTPKAAYVVNAGSSTVSQFSIGANGGIAAMSTTSVPAGGQPRSISVDPAGRFAFVANNTSNNVSVYSIDPGTRALTEVAGSPFGAGAAPTDVKVDPSGRFLYVSNYGDLNNGIMGTISAYTINATTGALAAIGGSPFSTEQTGTSSIDIDPSGRFLYATQPLNDTFSAFSINPATGVLTKLDANATADNTQDLTVTNAQPISITSDTTGRFVYVATACGANLVFSVDAWSGLLTRVGSGEIASRCYLTRTTPDIAAIDPSGSVFYTANYVSSDAVGAFTIKPLLGTLSAVPSKYMTGSGTVSVTVDQSGQYVYAAGSAGVYPFKIGSDGGLIALPGGSVAAGATPMSITTVGSMQ